MLYINRKTAYRRACECVRRGIAWSFEIRFVKRPGKDRWDVECGWQARLRDVRGKVVGFA